MCHNEMKFNTIKLRFNLIILTQLIRGQGGEITVFL